MIALLTFLIRFCPQLLEKPGFKFRDSEVGRNPIEGSYILLESDDVQIYICNERDEITWRIRSLDDRRNNNWFSFDLVSTLLGHRVATGVMDAANSEWLSKHQDKIITRFKKEQVAATLETLNELKAQRTKRI